MRIKKKKSFSRVSTKAKKQQSDDSLKRVRIRIIGIGGGGNSIVSEIALRTKGSNKKIGFVAANTDIQALKGTAKIVKTFTFGRDLTQGLGTGMDPDIGRAAALKEKERIKKLFQDQDICIFIATLGAGTGSGSAPVFAEISKNLGLITYGIFTLPFKFEGSQKMRVAKAALERLKPNLNAFSVIPNERIFRIINKETFLRQSLSAINQNLADSLEGLIEMIYKPGLINLDFADLKAILEKRGQLAYLTRAQISGSGRDKEIIKKVISNSLYPYGIQGAKGILFNIIGKKNISLNEISQISATISDLVDKNAKIIFGVGRSNKEKSKTRITLLAAGCADKIFSQKIKKVGTKNKPKRKYAKPQQKLTPSKPPKKEEIKKPEKKISKVSKERKIEPPKKDNAVSKVQTKIRRSALQIQKEIEKEEKEILKEEKKWEVPAFLRRAKNTEN